MIIDGERQDHPDPEGGNGVKRSDSALPGMPRRAQRASEFGVTLAPQSGASKAHYHARCGLQRPAAG